MNLWGAPRGAGQWPGVRREQNWETRGRKDCTREERGVRTPPTWAPGARRTSGRLVLWRALGPWTGRLQKWGRLLGPLLPAGV